jgi:hypothetical protein
MCEENFLFFFYSVPPLDRFLVRRVPNPESSYCTIEEQAFSLPSDLALSPSPFPSPVGKVDVPNTEKMRKRNDLLTGGKGVGEREGAKSYDGEKA